MQRHNVGLEIEQIDCHKRAPGLLELAELYCSRQHVHGPLPFLLLLPFRSTTPKARINITVSAGRKVKGQAILHNLLG